MTVDPAGKRFEGALTALRLKDGLLQPLVLTCQELVLSIPAQVSAHTCEQQACLGVSGSAHPGFKLCGIRLWIWQSTQIEKIESGSTPFGAFLCEKPKEASSTRKQPRSEHGAPVVILATGTLVSPAKLNTRLLKPQLSSA